LAKKQSGFQIRANQRHFNFLVAAFFRSALEWLQDQKLIQMEFFQKVKRIDKLLKYLHNYRLARLIFYTLK
jgi:hypothetical protein